MMEWMYRGMQINAYADAFVAFDLIKLEKNYES